MLIFSQVEAVGDIETVKQNILNLHFASILNLKSQSADKIF